MVESTHSPHKKNKNKKSNNNNNSNNNILGRKKYNKLASMGKISVNIINELYNPVDAVNRFLNLALQNIDEDSQSRQFILESKSGLRKMSTLLKKLTGYAKRMEREINSVLSSILVEENE